MRLMAAIAIACISVSASVSGQSPDDVRRMAGEAERRMRELQAESDRLAAQTSTLLGQLRKLELEREIKAQAVKKAEAELREVTTATAATAARVQALESQRLAGAAGVNERLVEIYKRGRGGYVRMLMAADDLRALGRMSRGVAAVARLDRSRIDAHRRTIRAERDALTELETRKKAMASAQAQAAKAQQALNTAVAVHNRRLDDLDGRRDLAARYVGELQEAASALQTRLAGLNSDTPAALPIAPFRGTLEWPARGRIVTRFGRNRADRFGTTVNRNGIEIATPPGDDVRAVHGGTVAFAAPFVGFGTLVIVDHGNSAFTLYGHLQESAVAQGTRVERGSVVGRAGRNPDGAEVVYFEVRIDGRPVDPVQWLRSPR